MQQIIHKLKVGLILFLSIKSEYRGLNELAVRSFEPRFADNRSSKCGLGIPGSKLKQLLET